MYVFLAQILTSLLPFGAGDSLHPIECEYDDDDHSWIGFNPEHLDAFLITEKGLLLFQNYVVSGYDDFTYPLYQTL